MKRGQEAQHEGEGANTRRVDYGTFQKWQCDLDREHQTMSWLDCVAEREGAKSVVTKLKCKVCTELANKI